MIYEIPFAYPSDRPAVEVANLIKKHSIDINAQTSWSTLPGEYIIEGTMENLTNFLAELESHYPAEQFKDYVIENNLV